VVRLRVLLAEAELYRGHGGTSQYLLLTVAVGGVVLAIVGFYLWNQSRKSRDGRDKEASPEDILAELCKVHELTRAEQSLITLLARNTHLAQPACIFVDPWPLEQAAEAADPDASHYRALHEKLFGSIN
jgi:hypothetical protein